jgi:hypothetical protein
MKIIKITLISFAALAVVLIIAAVIFLKTFDVNRYKPQIVSEAGKALGRKIDFQKVFLGVTLTQGVSLKINGLTISEDPGFGKGNFLSVKDISVGVDVLGYLLQKKVNISGIIIDSPEVTIIRRQDGSINAQTISQPAAAGKELAKASPATAAVAIPAILISTIKNLNGTVTYIDYSFEPPIRLEIRDINSTVSRLSLTDAFPFTLTAAVLSDKKNISLEGKAKFDLKTNQFTLSELKGGTELANILIAKIPQAFPMLKGMVLPGSVKGSLNFNLDKLTAGPQGLATMSAQAGLANASLQFKELAAPLQNIAANVSATEKKITLEKTSLNIGGGSVNATGSLGDYLAKQDFSADADIKDLKLEEMLVQDKSPVKIEGIASGKIKIKGSGFTPEALKANLSGNADIAVSKAKLKDLNVLRAVLDKIALLPGLAERIEAGLPDKYKQKLAGKDTVLSDIKIPLVIENGRLVIADLVVVADEFQFKGSGQAGLSGAYSVEGSLFIPADLSASMVSQVAELKYLLDENKQIFIPLKVSGNATETKFKVDGEYIARKLVQNQLKQQIFKALGGGQGGQDNSSNATDQQTSSGAQSTEKNSSTEEAVGSLLRGLFKK